MKLIYQLHQQFLPLSYIKSSLSLPHSLSQYRFYSEKDKSDSNDVFDILEEKVEEEIGYDQWLSNTKEALSKSKGKYWLGKTTVLMHTLII